MGKFLSQETFSYFWKNKLKPLLDSKVNAVSGKGLSTNDYTNADKQAIDSLEDSVIALQSTKLDKTGNAASANRLATSVKIGSAIFDGSKDISLEQIGAYSLDNIRYMDFNISVEDWKKNLIGGNFVVDLTASVTGNTWIIFEVINGTDDFGYSSPILWWTYDGRIELMTAEKPTGPISGRMLLMEVKS